MSKYIQSFLFIAFKKRIIVFTEEYSLNVIIKSSCKKNYITFCYYRTIGTSWYFIFSVVNIKILIQNSDKNRNTMEDNFYVYVTKIRNTSTFMKYSN
jgi:hypothetical protein